MASNRDSIFLDSPSGIRVYNLPKPEDVGEYYVIGYTRFIDHMVAGNTHLLIITSGKPNMIDLSNNNSIDVNYSGDLIVHTVFYGDKGYVVDRLGVLHYFCVNKDQSYINFVRCYEYSDVKKKFASVPKIKKSIIGKSRRYSMLLCNTSNDRLIVSDEFSIRIKNRRLILNCHTIYEESEHDTCGLILSNVVDISVCKRGVMILDSCNNIYSYGLNSCGRLGVGSNDMSINKLTKLDDLDCGQIIHIKLQDKFSIVITRHDDLYNVLYSGKLKSENVTSLTKLDVIS